jgi:hypothetical protein
VAKFRKKPVVIEAVQLTGLGAVRNTSWLRRALDQAELWPEPGTARFAADVDALEIATLEGIHRASIGDWIIRGIKGELYPCKPDIFAATYEAVD